MEEEGGATSEAKGPEPNLSKGTQVQRGTTGSNWLEKSECLKITKISYLHWFFVFGWSEEMRMRYLKNYGYGVLPIVM